MTIRCPTCNGACCNSPSDVKRNKRPVIAIAGVSCETSMFTPARTEYSAFHALRDEEIFDQYTFLRNGTSLGDEAKWCGSASLTARALPGGVVSSDAFEQLTNEIIERLKQLIQIGPIDGLWYDVHGAMCVEGIEDGEVELLRRIRHVIGFHTIVSASLDLHGNVSRELVRQADLITCYRKAPHEDEVETKERACRNLVNVLYERQDCLKHERKFELPIKAWIPVPILLPGEQTSTRSDPAKSIYEAVSDVVAGEGIVDASAWVGYCWSDERRSHASVVCYGHDKRAVKHGAEKLARLFWNARQDFHFAAPTASFDECLDTALASTATPYLISDSGDNPTAGGSGDVTWTIHKLLSRANVEDLSSQNIIYASLPGPSAVEEAVQGGVGSTISVRAGAEVDDIHGGPVTLSGRVYAIKHGDPDAQTEVVLQLQHSNVFVILTQLRKPYHYKHDFTDLNLDVSKGNDVIVIVKIGYLEPELYDLAAGWMLALTPGGVDQDLLRLGHGRIQRPMWPFDKHFEREPNLCANIVDR